MGPKVRVDPRGRSYRGRRDPRTRWDHTGWDRRGTPRGKGWGDLEGLPSQLREGESHRISPHESSQAFGRTERSNLRGGLPQVRDLQIVLRDPVGDAPVLERPFC